jgi:hypothetical protein
MTVVRRPSLFLVAILTASPGAAGLLAACQLLDPASTLDKDWRGDGGTIADGGSGSSDSPGVHCYVDVIEEEPIFDYCPSGEACCYSAALAKGECQSASSCAGLAFTCSDRAQCPSTKICCAQSELQGDFLVLQGSTCEDTCSGSQPLILCDLDQSMICPKGTTCQTNGANNKPLGYDSCKP